MGPASLTNRPLGEYRTTDLIGAGGMGEVYRAVHTRLQREVAVKVLSVSAQAQGAAFFLRFENEARLQAALHHPNLATLFDFFESEGRLCIAMELIEGPTLADLLRGKRPMTAVEARRIFAQVVEAIAHVHAHGVVHRDIKPGNIKVRPDGVVKVLDFGVAKGRCSPALTAQGMVVGTQPYLAPEQLRRGQSSPRSDVWALGVLLQEMLTGTVAATPLPTGAAELDRVIVRCLAVEPADRYADAGALRAELRGGSAAARVRGRSWGRGLRPTVLGATVLLGAGLAVEFWPPASDGPVAAGRAIARSRIDVVEGRAEVLIDGVRRGTTPIDVELHGGEVTVELRQDGFTPLVRRFDPTTRSVWTFAMQRARARE